MYKDPQYHKEGNIQEKAVLMIMLTEDHIGIGDPLREGDIPVKVKGHLMEEDTQIEDLLGEDIPIEMEGLPEEEDILEEDPLMVETPWRWSTPWTPWWTRTTRPSRTSWASETYNSPDSSSNTGYICSREYF